MMAATSRACLRAALVCVWIHQLAQSQKISETRGLQDNLAHAGDTATAPTQHGIEATAFVGRQPAALEPLPHCRAGVIEWDPERGQAVQRACKTPGTHWPHLAACISGKKIAFLGDSHVRNAFRCFVESASGSVQVLVGGTYVPTIQQHPGHYPFALQPEEASECPKKSVECPAQQLVELTPAPNASHNRIAMEDMDLHWPTCSNMNSVHNHDYHVVLEREGSSLDLWFFWNPLDSGGEGPGDDDWVLSYAGPRTRRVLLRELHDQGFDMVITGSLSYNWGGYNGHDHTYLYEYFHNRGMLLNHRTQWWTDGKADFELSQKHGIITIDAGMNESDYASHLYEPALRVQAHMVGIGLLRYFPCSTARGGAHGV